MSVSFHQVLVPPTLIAGRLADIPIMVHVGFQSWNFASAQCWILAGHGNGSTTRKFVRLSFFLGNIELGNTCQAYAEPKDGPTLQLCTGSCTGSLSCSLETFATRDIGDSRNVFSLMLQRTIRHLLLHSTSQRVARRDSLTNAKAVPRA